MNQNRERRPVYLETWFLCILFAFSFLIIPLIAGIVLLVMHYKNYKETLSEYDTIDNANEYAKTVAKESERRIQQSKVINEKRTSDANMICEQIENRVAALKREKSKLETQIKEINKEITYNATQFRVDEDITSEEYKNKLSLLILEEKEYIKSDKAVVATSSAFPTKKQLNAKVKQILRNFNSESTTITSAVTVKNIDSLRNRLVKSYESINSIFIADGVCIDRKLLEMKLEELNLIYSYKYQREQEKEQQKAIREQMVEEERVRREIKQAKDKLEKEEIQFKNEISKLMGYMQKSSEVEKMLYIDKIKELEEKLKLLDKDKENVLQREQNTRAGFVYVISNIGSLGENVYKIGMTRRLEPMDRIKELSSASVPFEFDVHAMIFSDDAPTLENILHSEFKDKRVNKINPRKEFFKVDIDDIEKVVKENYNAIVTFTKTAEAYQYRESLKLNQSAIA